MSRHPAKPSIAAAVDIGSYSVHLLVAEIDGHALRVIHDESAFLGLGRRGGRDGAQPAAGRSA